MLKIDRSLKMSEQSMVNLWMKLHYSTEIILEILITRGNGMKKSIGNANVKIEDFLLSMEWQEYGYIFDFSSISTIARSTPLATVSKNYFWFSDNPKDYPGYRSKLADILDFWFHFSQIAKQRNTEAVCSLLNN